MGNAQISLRFFFFLFVCVPVSSYIMSDTWYLFTYFGQIWRLQFCISVSSMHHLPARYLSMVDNILLSTSNNTTDINPPVSNWCLTYFSCSQHVSSSLLFNWSVTQWYVSSFPLQLCQQIYPWPAHLSYTPCIYHHMYLFSAPLWKFEGSTLMLPFFKKFFIFCSTSNKPRCRRGQTSLWRVIVVAHCIPFC